MQFEGRLGVDGRYGHVRMKGQHAPRYRHLQQNGCPGKKDEFTTAEAKIGEGYL